MNRSDIEYSRQLNHQYELMDKIQKRESNEIYLSEIISLNRLRGSFNKAVSEGVSKTVISSRYDVGIVYRPGNCSVVLFLHNKLFVRSILRLELCGNNNEILAKIEDRYNLEKDRKLNNVSI